MRNNLVHLPSAASVVELSRDNGADLVSDHDLLADVPGLTAPDKPDHL